MSNNADAAKAAIQDQNEKLIPLEQFRQNIKTVLQKGKHSVVSTPTNNTKKSVSVNCKTEASANLVLSDLFKEGYSAVRSGEKTVVIYQVGVPQKQTPEPDKATEESNHENERTSAQQKQTLNVIKRKTLELLRTFDLKHNVDYLSLSVKKKSKFISLNCPDRASAEKLLAKFLQDKENFPYFVNLKDGVKAINISARKPAKPRVGSGDETVLTKRRVHANPKKSEAAEYVPVLQSLIGHLRRQSAPEVNTEKVLKEALLKGYNKLLNAGKNAELFIRTRDGSNESNIKISKADFFKAFED